jgi:hypothetical protein
VYTTLTHRLKRASMKQDRHRTDPRDFMGLRHAMEQSAYFKAYREKFGRDPEPNDPIMFDPDADTPVPIKPEKLRRIIVEAFKHTFINPAIIYAFEKTGFFISEDNQHLFSKKDIAEWNAAIEEWKRIQADPEIDST